MNKSKNGTPSERASRATQKPSVEAARQSGEFGGNLSARVRPVLTRLAPIDAYLEGRLAAVRLPGRLAKVSPRHRLLSVVAILLVLVALIVPLTVSRVQANMAEAQMRAAVQKAYSEGLALHGSPTPSVSLKDQHGQTISLSQFKGHPVVLTFFDSVCPHSDCSLMAQYINWTTTHMTPQQVAQVDWVAISVNPWHDTTQTVDAFLQSHQVKIPMHYLMGTPDQLKPIWDALHMQVVLQSDGIVLHTTGVYVLDGSGKEQLYLDEGFDPAVLGGYLQYMLQNSKTGTTQQATSSQAKNTVSLAKTVNGDTIQFTATPGTFGSYDFTIAVEDQKGTPVPGATVSAVMHMTDMEMVPVTVNFSPSAVPGAYETKGAISMRGRWAAQVTVAIPGQAPLQTTFNFTANY